jgi:hypothetical protein
MVALSVVLACEAVPEPERAPAAAGADTMSTAMRAALAEFRTTVHGPPPTTITGGAATRAELIRQFADAIARADTAALIRMTMSRAEFAFLHYPHTIYIHPPYELDAETSWMLSRANTEKGLTRILQRFAGQPFDVVAYRCPEEPRREGPNRYYDRCTLQRAGSPPDMRWFGSIWERAGRFKFASYANDF